MLTAYLIIGITVGFVLGMLMVHWVFFESLFSKICAEIFTD